MFGTSSVGVPFAHAKPEIRDPITLLLQGRDLALPFPKKSLPELAEWAHASLLGSGPAENLEWETRMVHCFWLIAFFSTIIYWMRGLAFWVLDAHAQRAVSDPREKNLASLSSEEQATLTKSKELLTKKYKKYVWHCFAYVIMISWGFRILKLAPWSALNQLTFDHMAINLPNHSDHTQFKVLMEEYSIFSMLQLSWYVAGGVENLIHDRSRSDFLMMLLHHFLTILLIYGAFLIDCHRCAVHITVTLDIGDIAMYYCKSFHLRTSNFDGTAKSGYRFAHLLHLASLTGIWVVTRLYFYGLEIVTMWVWNPWTTENVSLPFVACYLKIFLAALWVLQLIWGVALGRMVWQQAREGEFRDNVSGDTESLRKAAEKNRSLDSSADSSATEDIHSAEKVAGPRRRVA